MNPPNSTNRFILTETTDNLIGGQFLNPNGSGIGPSTKGNVTPTRKPIPTRGGRPVEQTFPSISKRTTPVQSQTGYNPGTRQVTPPAAKPSPFTRSEKRPERGPQKPVEEKGKPNTGVKVEPKNPEQAENRKREAVKKAVTRKEAVKKETPRTEPLAKRMVEKAKVMKKGQGR